MHFYTALDWTCQDWTRADPSLFSLRSWKENGEHKRWNFCFLMELLKAFYILHWNKNEAFRNVARESREKATHAGCGRGENKGLRGSSPERVSVGPRELDQASWILRRIKRVPKNWCWAKKDGYCERPHRAREKTNRLGLTVLTWKWGDVTTSSHFNCCSSSARWTFEPVHSGQTTLPGELRLTCTSLCN